MLVWVIQVLDGVELYENAAPADPHFSDIYNNWSSLVRLLSIEEKYQSENVLDVRYVRLYTVSTQKEYTSRKQYYEEIISEIYKRHSEPPLRD